MTKLTRKTIVKHDCLHCQFYGQYSCELDRCFLEAELSHPCEEHVQEPAREVG